jgi:hypothetical protein
MSDRNHYYCKMTRKPKQMTKNLHAMKTRMKGSIEQSLSKGKDLAYCSGCTLTAQGSCVMDTLYVGMFENLESNCGGDDKKKITPCELHFKAYKYCSSQIHGKMGWQDHRPLPICVETYIKTWFAEHQYPYNFAGFCEPDPKNDVM